jgi:hypothetical protein
MRTRKEWAVALLGNLINGEPEIIPYPSRQVAQVAADSWHAWDIPVVIHREVPDWLIDQPEREQTLDETVEIFKRSQNR